MNPRLFFFLGSGMVGISVKLKTEDYQLFLFDLEGLLIDTDALHLQAYVDFLKKRKYELPWTLEEYVAISRSSASAIKEQVYELFPELHAIQPEWENLYKEKRQAYIALLKKHKISLMPGAEAFLNQMLYLGKTVAIVTNASKEEVEIIRAKVPILNQIQDWVLREDYEKATPDSQCYKIAIDKFSFARMGVIGFEDSARGLIALLGSSATSILVSRYDYPQLAAYSGRYQQVESFEAIELVPERSFMGF